MAEIESPSLPTDWAFQDRLNFTSRWNDANAFNLMRPQNGASEYRAISQRTAFYDWFDQIREVQKQDILWPAAAWIVAQQMANVDKPLQGQFVSGKIKEFAHAGNKAIFDDVFPRLGEAFKRGLAGKPLKGDEAAKWDRDTLQNEQFKVAQPLYEKFARNDPDVQADLLKMASGGGLFALGGVAIAGALDFHGDLMDPQDRFDHGMKVVVAFYKRFKQAIDAGRAREQRSKPDPTAQGRIQFQQAPPPPTPQITIEESTLMYVVQSGDTLPRIAGKFYKDPALWPVIYNEPSNRKLIGNNSEVIRVGWQLNIPPKPVGAQ